MTLTAGFIKNSNYIEYKIIEGHGKRKSNGDDSQVYRLDPRQDGGITHQGKKYLQGMSNL
jgi:hypothetical protein